MPDGEGSVFSDLPGIRELPDGSSAHEHFDSPEPFIIRNLAGDWPVVRAGLESGKAARDYLLAYHKDRPFAVHTGPADLCGRVFYRDDMRVNFEFGHADLPDIFHRIEQNESRSEQELIYLSSIDMRTYFPGLHEANPVDLGGIKDYLASIWIGTRTRVPAHFDAPRNLACVAVGHRRFTLFPPDQFRNLYIGPLDNTPAGRPISLVDFHAPDFARHPRFAEALKTAQTAVLAPGDAIFIPSLWWHHIEGLDAFNILMNYWWFTSPRHMGEPEQALYHAIMAIRSLPKSEKQAWRDMFAHYVFDDPDVSVAHIPKQARGILGEPTPERSAKIRGYLLKGLNR